MRYTSDEYSGKVGGSKKGWGHSTWAEGVRVAKDAGVKTFVLFHHDPSHDDAFVTSLEAECRGTFPDSVAAREGMILDVGESRVRVPGGATAASSVKKNRGRKKKPAPKK